MKFKIKDSQPKEPEDKSNQTIKQIGLITFFAILSIPLCCFGVYKNGLSTDSLVLFVFMCLSIGWLFFINWKFKAIQKFKDYLSNQQQK